MSDNDDDDNVSKAQSDIETILRKLDTTIVHIPDDILSQNEEEEQIGKDLWDKKLQYESKYSFTNFFRA
jgi:hypothetical protein